MSERFLPARALTGGPRLHWFGYYEKLQFDPSQRFVLGMEVDFEHRRPTGQDVIRVGMIDLHDGDRWIELGESRAWCWQQGCMLQWVPGSQNEIIWNDRQGGRFVSRILNVETRKQRTLPAPVAALSGDGLTALYQDFSRIEHTRPGYGYAGLPDPAEHMPVPPDSGIWALDIATGRTRMLISLADVAGIPHPREDYSRHLHWLYGMLWNPDGSRFAFLHSWRQPGGGFGARLLTAAADGSDIRMINDQGGVSHFIWRDARHILAFSKHSSPGRAFYLYEDGTEDVRAVGASAMTLNGHVSYLPDTRWILNDSYPDQDSNQQLYLYHVPTDRRIDLGRFYSPPEYRQGSKEWRCDLHPRHSPDGRHVVVDSAHEGQGRQMYLLDIGPIID